MTRMIFISFFCLLLSLGSLTASETDKIDDIVEPPLCYNNEGEQVYFQEIANIESKAVAGMARRNEKGEPVVYRFNYHIAHSSLQRFIDLHECAHHQTGDIDRPHPPRNSPDHLMNESIADCIAILRIRDDYDGSKTELASISHELSQEMHGLGFPAITINSRLSNIHNCYKKAQSSEAFISQVLEERKE